MSAGLFAPFAPTSAFFTGGINAGLRDLRRLIADRHRRQHQGVLSCPAGTSVAKNCPSVWMTYASLLGIDLGQPMMPKELEPMPTGCRAAPGTASTGGLLTLLLLAGLALLRRRA